MQLNTKRHLFREVLKSISLHNIANKVADLYLRMTSREENMSQIIQVVRIDNFQQKYENNFNEALLYKLERKHRV